MIIQLLLLLNLVFVISRIMKVLVQVLLALAFCQADNTYLDLHYFGYHKTSSNNIV